MNHKLSLTWLGISLCLILPPFLLGGVYSHLETNFVIIFITSLVSAGYFSYLLIYKKPVTVSLILIPLSALLFYSFFQLIPLPVFLLRILSPKGLYFHSIESGGSRPLTMSVPDTIYSSLRIITLILFAAIFSRAVFSGRRKIKTMFINTIIFTGTAVIFISAVFRILQINRWLYGILKSPGFLLEPIIVNPNHAAAFFGISGLLSLFMVFRNDFKRIKIFYGTIFFIHTIAVIATVSKGGILAYFLSIIFLLFLQKGENSGKNRERKKIFLMLSVLFALTVSFYAGFSVLEKTFWDVGSDKYFDKIENLRTVKDYFGDFYITGSGTGSFSRTYPYYQTNPEKHFDQLENEPVQFVLETGVFFSFFFIILFLYMFSWKEVVSENKKGVIAILFFVLLHNTVDFNLHNFSILFPVITILVFMAKPVELKGRGKYIFLVTMLILSVFALLMASSASGRKLCGYNPDKKYDSLIYLYPADYSIPLYEAVKNMNTFDPEKTAASGKFISAAILKAPQYYFVYYLAGKYMTRIGSSQGIEFYKKSVALSDPLKISLLRGIYNDLKYIKKKKAIVEILKSVPLESNSVVERFVFEFAEKDSDLSEYIIENRDIYFFPALEIYFKNKEYDKAEEFIGLLRKKHEKFGAEQTGGLLMYEGRLKEIKGLYSKAFDDFLKGSTLTENFGDYLLLANCSLKLGKKEIEIAETKLKKANLFSTNAMTAYYRWLSRKEFLDNNFAKGMKMLEKAEEISKNPAIAFEIAKIYSQQKIYMKSLEHLSKLKKNFPDFRKKEVDDFYNKEQKKLSQKESELFKEFLLKQDH